MTFAEKLVFLMKLTSASNKQLANAVKVDPSLISLLRNGRRDAPRNRAHIQAMAAFFARRCEGDYQRMALSEALGRKHLQIQMDADQLAAILFDWLTDGRDQVAQFLNTFERLSLEPGEGAPPKEAAADPRRGSTSVFFGSEGKRGATDAFIAHLLTLEEPGCIHIASDENLTWLFEEGAYLPRLQEQIQAVLQRGFRICRVASPLYTAEQAFDSLSLWLPLYITGQVESFFYPRLRDELHRRTLFVLPEEEAVLATSIGEKALPRATLYTQDKRLVASAQGEFQDLLVQCRPMMTAYSTKEGAADILRLISQFETDAGDRIQQSTSLSSITTPEEVLRLCVEGLPAREADAILDLFTRVQSLFLQSLSAYEMIDIHSIATAKQVREGEVPVSAAYLRRDRPIYHTPATYAAHLQRILDIMEDHPRYCPALLPRDRQTHALMVKDGRQAILLRAGTPLMVFEVSQPYVAEACRAYLQRRIRSPYTPFQQRRDVASRIKQLIAELKREI